MGIVMRQAKLDSMWHVVRVVVLAWLSAAAVVASAQVKINVLQVGPVLPLSIAQEQGFFTKHGVEVRLILVPGPDVPRLTDENPVGYVGAPGILLRTAEGADVRIVGSFSNDRATGYLVARPDIKKPEELRGKRVGVRALGAGLWIQTILALEHLGLDPKRDNISTLAIGEPPQIVQALEAGSLDAAVLPVVQSGQLKAKGFSVLLELYPANIYVPINALAATAPYLQQAPDVIEKVVAALIESVAFGVSPTNKASLLSTIMRTFKVTDAALAEEIYQSFLRVAVRKPYPSLDRLRDMQRIMAHHDPRVLNVRVEDLVDDRVVRKLDESGALDRLYSPYGAK